MKIHTTDQCYRFSPIAPSDTALLRICEFWVMEGDLLFLPRNTVFEASNGTQTVEITASLFETAHAEEAKEQLLKKMLSLKKQVYSIFFSH